MSKESDQKVKDALAAIRKELTSEELDKISSDLKTIEREFSDVFEDAKSFLGETKDRKEKLREKDAEIDKLQDEIDSLKSDETVSKLQKQIDDLKAEKEQLGEYKTSVLQEKRKGFLNQFDQIKDHADYEKIQKYLKLPEEKDGKLDWDLLEDAEIERNFSEVQKAKDLGLFGSAEGGTNNPARRSSGTSTNPFEGKFKT